MEIINLLSEKDYKYKYIESDPRTILLIGRSQTGKTTLINVLKSPSYIQPLPKLYSKTKKTEMHSIGTFKVIDTPGFFDHVQFSQENMPLTNDDILSSIDQCLNCENGIHLIGLVFKLSSGINNEDIDTMIYVKKKYPELASNMALVLTHCEEQDKDDGKKLVKEFFKHDRVQQENLKELFQQGVLFMGCIRYISVKRNNQQALMDEFQQVLKFRETFIETCIRCKPLKVNRYNRCHRVNSGDEGQISVPIHSNENKDMRNPHSALLQKNDTEKNAHTRTYYANPNINPEQKRELSCCAKFCLAICCCFLLIMALRFTYSYNVSATKTEALTPTVGH